MVDKNYKAFKQDLKALRKRYGTHTNKLDEFTIIDTDFNRNYLVSTAISLVEKLSYKRKERCNNVILVNDLIQNGMIGVMSALGRWLDKSPEDRRKFPNFKAFSYIWIEKYIKEYIDVNLICLKHPIKKHKEVLEEFKTIRSLSSDDAIFDYCVEHDSLSIDGFETDNNSLNDILLKTLGKKDSDLLKSYFGFNGEKREDLEKSLSMSKPQLNRYCRNLITKLTKASNSFDKEMLYDLYTN